MHLLRRSVPDRGTDTVTASGTEASPSPGGRALVIGASGAIGTALSAALESDHRFSDVTRLSRTSVLPVELTSEPSMRAAASAMADANGDVRLIIDATGSLHREGHMPEKRLRDLDADALMDSFALNAIGPAMLMKHFLPLLPRTGRSVFATLSARVGSIGDNELGGWYGYRASKAALNQFVRTAAIELRRTRPEAICIALHPGTVDSRLSAPFAKTDLDVRAPEVAAAELLAVLDGLVPENNGGFFDHRGAPVPW